MAAKFRSYYETLAPYASLPAQSRGRLHNEDESLNRSVFQRDRDRIIHCSTFRRMKHKTQVFVHHQGDHFRTRLTHSIEVAQIARSIARTLHLDEDLAEALALAHDFGHTAFGHAGEEALNACMKDFGGFDHNAHTLRLVTSLERRYAAFDGLNLTWETLEGLVKHNGPLADSPIDARNPPADLPWALRAPLAAMDLEIHSWPGPEAQVVAISDDIAYNNHDVDDGLRAGLFTVQALSVVPLVAEVLAEIEAAHGILEGTILIHELVRRLINRMCRDILRESEDRLEALDPRTVSDIRGAEGAVVGFSNHMLPHEKALKAFLHQNMYEHAAVKDMAGHGKKVVTGLFSLYREKPGLMPEAWASEAGNGDELATAQAVSDFIAGMTDRYALREYEAHCGDG